MNIYSLYSHGPRCPTIIEGPSMTQQQFAADCNINRIVAKYMKTGILGDPGSERRGVYQDVSELPDFQKAQGVVAKANEAFAALPGALRARFGHDPAAFVAFCQDAGNRAEAEKLGLLAKPMPAKASKEAKAGKDEGEDVEPVKEPRKGLKVVKGGKGAEPPAEQLDT